MQIILDGMLLLQQQPTDEAEMFRFFEWLTSTAPGRLMLVIFGGLIALNIFLVYLFVRSTSKTMSSAQKFYQDMQAAQTEDRRSQNAQENTALGIISESLMKLPDSLADFAKAVTESGTRILERVNEVNDEREEDYSYVSINQRETNGLLKQISETMESMSKAMEQSVIAVGSVVTEAKKLHEGTRQVIQESVREEMLQAINTYRQITAVQNGAKMFHVEFQFPEDDDCRWGTHPTQITPVIHDRIVNVWPKPYYADQTPVFQIPAEGYSGWITCKTGYEGWCAFRAGGGEGAIRGWVDETFIQYESETPKKFVS